MRIHTANRRSGRYRRNPYTYDQWRDIQRAVRSFCAAVAWLAQRMQEAVTPALAAFRDAVAAQAEAVREATP